jgi:molybdopterin-guanine dinucleotide biosynthesis protein A
MTFDEIEGQGPLAGFVAGLEAASHEQCFVASCDVPLLRPELVKFLLERLPGHCAVVPLVGDREQPLVAAYDRARAVAPLRASLDAGIRRVRDAVRALEPLFVDEADLALMDPELVGFANVNDPAELAALAVRAARG